MKKTLFNFCFLLTSCRTETEINTYHLLCYFTEIDSIVKIKERNFEALEKRFFWSIFAYSVCICLLFVGEVFTFSFLEDKSLSLLPLACLVAIVILLIFLIIDWMKWNVISDCMNGRVVLDVKILDLMIMKLELLEKSPENDKQYEMHSLLD